MVTLVVVDDVDANRLLLRRFIELDERLEVIGEARSAAEAIEVVGRLHPDAVILDHEMPGMTGAEAVPQLVQSEPKVIVVMYSSGPLPETERIAMAAGAHGYFQKTDPVPDLLDAIVDLVKTRAVA